MDLRLSGAARTLPSPSPHGRRGRPRHARIGAFGGILKARRGGPLVLRDRLRYRRRGILGNRPIQLFARGAQCSNRAFCRVPFLATARPEHLEPYRKGLPCTCFVGQRSCSTAGRRIHLSLTFAPPSCPAVNGEQLMMTIGLCEIRREVFAVNGHPHLGSLAASAVRRGFAR